MSSNPFYLSSVPGIPFYFIPPASHPYSQQVNLVMHRSQEIFQYSLQRNVVPVSQFTPPALPPVVQYAPLAAISVPASSAPHELSANSAAKRPADSNLNNQPLKKQAGAEVSMSRETVSGSSKPMFQKLLDDAVNFIKEKNYEKAIAAIRLSFQNFPEPGFATYLLSTINPVLCGDARSDILSYAYSLLTRLPCDSNGLLLRGLCNIEPGKYRVAQQDFRSIACLYNDKLAGILFEQASLMIKRDRYSPPHSIRPQPLPQTAPSLAKMKIDFLVNPK